MATNYPPIIGRWRREHDLSTLAGREVHYRCDGMNLIATGGESATDIIEAVEHVDANSLRTGTNMTMPSTGVHVEITAGDQS